MHEIKHQSSGEINKLNEFWIEKLERGKNIENDKHKELLVQVIEDLILEFELKTGTVATKQLPICTDAVSSQFEHESENKVLIRYKCYQ